MATVNFRIDDNLKEKSYAVMHQLGVTPTDIFKNVLQYIAETGKLPVKTVVVSDEDAELLALVKKRLNDPRDMFEEITLDDL